MSCILTLAFAGACSASGGAHVPIDSRVDAPSGPVIADDFDIQGHRGARGLAPPLFLTMRASHLDEAHAAGMRVIPYSINDPGDMRYLIDWGVDGLITDRPDVAMALLAELRAGGR